jgi:uncharacterized protein with HEPN domain
MQPETRKLLFDMQHAVLGIEMFVAGKSLNDYESDLMLRSAVERQLEIIGEAMTRLRKIDCALCNQITESQRIIGFRNVLIHGYDAITNSITWSIIQTKLPVLRTELDVMLKQ